MTFGPPHHSLRNAPRRPCEAFVTHKLSSTRCDASASALHRFTSHLDREQDRAGIRSRLLSRAARSARAEIEVVGHVSAMNVEAGSNTQLTILRNPQGKIVTSVPERTPSTLPGRL